MIPLTTKRAGPKLRTEVNLTTSDKRTSLEPVWIQNRTTVRLSTTNRLIRQCSRHSVDGFQRCVSSNHNDVSSDYKHPIGITHFVASIRVPGHVLNVKRIPSLSSASPISVT